MILTGEVLSRIVQVGYEIEHVLRYKAFPDGFEKVDKTACELESSGDVVDGLCRGQGCAGDLLTVLGEDALPDQEPGCCVQNIAQFSALDGLPHPRDVGSAKQEFRRPLAGKAGAEQEHPFGDLKHGSVLIDRVIRNYRGIDAFGDLGQVRCPDRNAPQRCIDPRRRQDQVGDELVPVFGQCGCCGIQPGREPRRGIPCRRVGACDLRRRRQNAPEGQLVVRRIEGQLGRGTGDGRGREEIAHEHQHAAECAKPCQFEADFGGDVLQAGDLAVLVERI
ncbi:hypothetical protein AAD018_018400, partial [Aestuariibius insulae]|uniref:hypothetical protein n=1 Tax=Aestuariibius insulae TaxID=2058287 RepID=UPI00398E3A6F